MACLRNPSARTASQLNLVLGAFDTSTLAPCRPSISDAHLRDRLAKAVCGALRPLPVVLAGWEGGSIAFDAADEYSDLDLNFLVDDTTATAPLYAEAEMAISSVSPIVCSHTEPPGRYYKLIDGGDYLLLDLCFLETGAVDHCLDVERHGRVRPLFDKGNWLIGKHLDAAALEAARVARYRELRSWFSVSQAFVRKTILRGQDAEALSAYWGYTLRPLVEMLRMRYCPVRWDFGMRYLSRDLPPDVYDELQDLIFVKEPQLLSIHLENATRWGEDLLEEAKSVIEHSAAGA